MFVEEHSYAIPMTNTYAEKQLLEKQIAEMGGLEAVIGGANLNITIHRKAFHLFREIIKDTCVAIEVLFQPNEVCAEFRDAIIEANSSEFSSVHETTRVWSFVYRAEGRMRVLVIPQFGCGNSLAVTADFGCSHEMERFGLGRCYNRYTCKKCGYSYEVDSGD